MLSPQCITRPLIRTQKNRSTNTYPPHPRSQPREKRPRPTLPQYRPQHSTHGLFLPRQHHPRLQHIKRRREPRGHGARHTTQQSSFPPTNLLLPRLRKSIPLQRFPQRELDDGKRHLADNRDAPPAIQFAPYMRETPGSSLMKYMLQRSETARMLRRLRALLDDFGRYPHRARSDLAQTSRQHMYQCFVACIAVFCFIGRAGRGVLGGWGGAKVPFYAVVGYEEEGGAGGAADDCAAYASVYACEAA
jgi:hypothetical protein